MKQRTSTKQSPRRTAEPTRARTYILMAVCVFTVVGGFFFAGRQHFSSMDYGMKNSKLRRQIDDLEAEKRRLMLAREVVLSPAEIKKAARKVGLLTDEMRNAPMAQVISSTKEKAAPSSPAVQDKPMIIKTAAVSPVRQDADRYVKTAKLVKTSKSSQTAN
jgi:hypothetical protein